MATHVGVVFGLILSTPNLDPFRTAAPLSRGVGLFVEIQQGTERERTTI